MKITHDLATPLHWYTTSDLSLACTLSLWFPIEKIEKGSSRKATFVFTDTAQLKDLVERYWRGQVKVEPQGFFNQLKTIKTRLYEAQ
jgi:hypothetical protein